MILKAELHCHIEGAASPAVVTQKARKYGVDVSGIISPAGEYYWTDFTDFLKAYDLAASLFRTRSDYCDLAFDYLSSLAREGAIYSEFFISTDHAIGAGLDPMDYVSGLADGIDRARSEHGIEARMIATGLRHKGPAAVEQAAAWIVANPHRLITGFGMAGDERMHHPRDFAKAFDMASDAGFGITVHAGELCGWQSVADALEWIRPSRIGHGVRAIENPALVEKLAREAIVLECCPGSNVYLKVFDSYEAHPLRALHDAGCKVTVSSDDPPHFRTTLGIEYDIAARHFGFSDGELTAMTRIALEAAYVDGDTRAALLEKLGVAAVV